MSQRDRNQHCAFLVPIALRRSQLRIVGSKSLLVNNAKMFRPGPHCRQILVDEQNCSNLDLTAGRYWSMKLRRFEQSAPVGPYSFPSERKLQRSFPARHAHVKDCSMCSRVISDFRSSCALQTWTSLLADIGQRADV